MNVSKAITIVAGVALIAILFVSLTTGAPKPATSGSSPAAVSQLGTGRPALYEFSTDS